MQSGALIIFLGLKILGVSVCSNKAKKLNRSSGGWEFFGFISPIIAMIWIHCMKPIMVWESNIEVDNQSEIKE